MTPAATAAAVTRHWGTGVVISDVALAGIVRDGFAGGITPEGPAFERITPESVVTDLGALEAEFTSSMTALVCTPSAPLGPTLGAGPPLDWASSVVAQLARDGVRDLAELGYHQRKRLRLRHKCRQPDPHRLSRWGSRSRSST